MLTKISTETAYHFGYPFGSTVEIVKVSVDYGDQGYTCYGYRFGAPQAIPGPLTYNSDWATPGDALNAAHDEKNVQYEG